ncbi:hypothetical protein [Tropicibacter naphthalenivorans]|uniref:Uncharacterized protein n=1 Tax=Tropicibacter naphthalenivorans TaxID=441103 RepID=A0A0P1G461_9RHOB|nr:hypothetical protein [Tropicibacter naphthalenivorans]CUH76597.1 hypothetical protein TRN7648_01019 [Tropicibacter naphthalenivorans]SMC64832.1 hypothetical protein SAMN04488093_102599 [Tropicibacter naphthalenivorans]
MSMNEAAAQGNTETASFLSGTAGILTFVALFLAWVALATATWGLPGLAMTALACVPVMYTVLILITFGK